MSKNFLKHLFLLIGSFLTGTAVSYGKAVIFYEKGFPVIESSEISRQSLQKAFSSMNPKFVNLLELKKNNALAKGDLLVLPYGSALPADAWSTIHQHLNQGNLLVLGGRPFFVPVYRAGNGWRIDYPQNTYSLSIGIEYSYEAPQHGPWKIQWDEDSPFFNNTDLIADRVFVNAGQGGRYRGLGFLVNDSGDRLAAPAAAEDLVGFNQIPRRRVYLSFETKAEFWNSEDGIELIKKAAFYASYGGCRLWIDLQQLTIDAGNHISGTVDIIRKGKLVDLAIELISGTRTIAERKIPCGNSMHEKIKLPIALNETGLYKVRASLSTGDTLIEQYTSGFFVRDTSLIHSGQRLETGRDFFRIEDKPYLMAGTNYFGTDAYTSGFFYGGSLGGNAYVWEKDFAEMEKKGLTTVRTGIWLNRAFYLSWVSGAPEERLLNALEAYISAAASHNLQVVFTFFAFEPQTEIEERDQSGPKLGPGSNPYLDPVATEAQLAYVRAITSRFKDVPFLSFDIINEPSFCNPKRIWKGNSPNGDPAELSAWQSWLKKRYNTIEQLSQAWRTTVSEIGSFEKIPLPSFPDFEYSRTGNTRNIRIIDYNLFAQESFAEWVCKIIDAIRSTGAKQLVTVGQDEGGVADRLLNQFWAESPVGYTVNHTWWRDDALLWSSIAAKTLNKPNVIGETGPQPVISIDRISRWDDIKGTPLLERKLALGFACANAGVLHWDWTRNDIYGNLRRDGSQKLWTNVLEGISKFAADAQAYAVEARLPETALVLPQSLQLSVFGGMSIEAQQKSVRALYHHARGTAFAVGEYQLSQMPDVKLIIVPSPWIISHKAWDILISKVKNGAVLLISGRIDADEHWIAVPERAKTLNINYESAPLATRETVINWPGGPSLLSYSGDKTTYAERGLLDYNQTFMSIQLEKGRILYSALPLEISDQLNEIGRIYKYAMKSAGVNPVYETSCEDPGILICPTQLPDATLYVLTSESSSVTPFSFIDKKSGKEFSISLEPGRAALLLAGKEGEILASYNIQ
ncbi:MAG: beta-galactosidase [Bacteroidetes bacterium]|nr:beta-galactosidase [Bacteroidota bacterium]